VTADNQLLDAALRYATSGWPVHPLHNPVFTHDEVRCTCRDGAKCDKIGKHPRLKGWKDKATTNEAQIRKWWAKWPEANIGVPCGPGSVLVLVDLDAESAKESIEAYAAEHNIMTTKEDLNTTSARTGNGSHLVFAWTDGCEQLQNYVKVVEGLDIRTEGGQFVVPPSRHFTGRDYEWTKPPWEVPPKPFPGWLLKFLLKTKNKARLERNAAKLEVLKTKARQKRATRRNGDDRRERAYAEAALVGELATLRSTPSGGRNAQLNASAFSLGGLVGAGLLDRARVVSELTAAARSIGLKSDEIEKTIASGLSAGESNPRSIPEAESEPPGAAPVPNDADILELLATLPDRVAENHRAAFEPETLELLATVKHGSPADWAEMRQKLKPTGVSMRDLEKAIRQHRSKAKKTEAEITGPIQETDPDIVAKAIEIVTNGDPVGYVLDVMKHHHAGDRRSAELLLCSVVIGSVLNANGTQPKLSGGSGKGKTHLCKALRHLMPPEWIFYTSLSPKALYRATIEGGPVQIKPGMVIFSDDVRINEDLEDTMKRSMSNFQEKARYLVVGKDGALLDMHLPERLIWWLTSVSDDQEEQLINRFFQVGIDESQEQDLKSLDLTFAPLAEGRAEFPVTDDVLVCREIIRAIKNETWMVWAPFLRDDGGELNLEWLNPEERRNPGRFVDLLAAYAVLHHTQRDVIDEGDHKKITATEDDFEAAKALYESRAENLTTKMADRELHFIRWLTTQADGTQFHFKINDVARTYKGPNGKGLSAKTLERMLLGRKDRNTYGLIDKIKGGGLVEAKHSETVDVGGDRSHKRQTQFRLFTFYPDKFDILRSYSGVVKLKTPQQGREKTEKTQVDPGLGSVPADPPDPGYEEEEDKNTHKTQGTQSSKSIDRGDGLDPGLEKESMGLWGGSSGYSGSTCPPDGGLSRPTGGSSGGSPREEEARAGKQ